MTSPASRARGTDTIAAIATAPGEGAIAIVRISGPEAAQVTQRIAALRKASLPSLRPNTVARCRLFDPDTLDPIDDALLLWFKAPRSYTGEDCVELHCHGGRITAARVLDAALRAGARAAMPGEFTYRAYLNGKLDLSQAEAVCDQIRAGTEQAQRLALRQREGRLSRVVHELRNQILDLLAQVEAAIDFSEEIGELDCTSALRNVEAIQESVRDLLANAEAGRLLREGFRLAIVGRPNVGKSSLLNAMLRTDRAIVSPIPGTTRDTIEERLNLRGVPCFLVDTAGLRATTDPVEAIGVERTRSSLEAADFALLVFDASEGWTAEDAALLEYIGSSRRLLVGNKADLGLAAHAPSDAHYVSALTGTGIGELEEALVQAISGLPGTAWESALVSRSRHVEALRDAERALSEAADSLAQDLSPDLVAVDLRGAAEHIGRITGDNVTEEVVNRVFRDFCIGK